MYRVVYVVGLGEDQAKQASLEVINVPEEGKFREIVGRESVYLAEKLISMLHAVLALVAVDFPKGILRCLGNNDFHA